MNLGRKLFIDRVWDWKANSGGTITNQLRRLGASLDWSRERFTMDEDLSAAVQEVFVQLYREGLIYRGKRLVNWDPVLMTAISDLEVISEAEDGSLWHFRYPIADCDEHVIIATTRPETMLGDTAVAVHPEDSRYSHLVGKTAHLPLVGRKIPIIADNYVDPEFGSGCVKITPAHDFNDYLVGKRNSLDVINVMTPRAEIDLPGSPYHGLDRTAARKKILEDLEALQLIEKVESHKYKVPRGDRTGQIIEPFLTDQWFVRTKSLAEPSIKAVQNGTIKFVPKTGNERISTGWRILRIGASRVKSGGGIEFQPGMTKKEMSSSQNQRKKRRGRRKSFGTEGMFALGKTRTYWTLGFLQLCGRFQPLAGQNKLRSWLRSTRPMS